MMRDVHGLSMTMATSVILISFLSPNAADFSESTDDTQRLYEARIALLDGMKKLAKEPSRNQREACEEQIDVLLNATPSLRVDDYYLAARSAEMLGLDEKAISILERVLEKHTDQKAPSLRCSVEVSANMWIGRLSLDAGRPQDSLDALHRAILAAQLEKLKLEEIIARLYVSEIEGSLLNDNSRAITSVQSILQESSRLQKDLWPDFFQLWAKRQYQEFSDATADIVCPPGGPLETCIFSFTSLNGITLDPSGGELHGLPNSELRSLFLSYLEITARESKNSIDRQTTELAAAEYRFDAQDFAGAEQILTQLFLSEAFLAPAAGVKLAQCLALQGDTARASHILQEMRKRWPNTEWAKHIDSLASGFAGAPQETARTPDGQRSQVGFGVNEDTVPTRGEQVHTEREEGSGEISGYGGLGESGSFGHAWLVTASLSCVVTIAGILAFSSLVKKNLR